MFEEGNFPRKSAKNKKQFLSEKLTITICQVKSGKGMNYNKFLDYYLPMLKLIISGFSEIS